MLARAFPSPLHTQPFRSFTSRHYSTSHLASPRITLDRPWATSHSPRTVFLPFKHTGNTPRLPHHTRLFSTSSPLRDSKHSTEPHHNTTPPTHTKPQPKPSPSLLSRIIPFSSGRTGIEYGKAEGVSRASSFRKIAALAYPERKPLLTATGLLLVSSTVTLSIPFSVGKLIDYFTTPEPVRLFLYAFCNGAGLLTIGCL